MSELYFVLGAKSIADQTVKNEPLMDMVSYTEINPQGRNYISYLRLVNRIPKIMVHWDTLSCMSTFITYPTQRVIGGKQYTVDPETTEPIHPGFVERIRLYNESVHVLGSDFSPAPHQINDIFQRYLLNQITDTEKLILRSFLFLEDTEVLLSFESTGLHIRKEAEERLLQHESGTWLLRKSSVIDSDLVKAKVVSINQSGKIIHVMCIHAKGYGYFSPEVISQEQVMPDLSPECRHILPHPSREKVYACFLDWFEVICTSYDVVRSQYIQ